MCSLTPPLWRCPRPCQFIACRPGLRAARERVWARKILTLAQETSNSSTPAFLLLPFRPAAAKEGGEGLSSPESPEGVGLPAPDSPVRAGIPAHTGLELAPWEQSHWLLLARCTEELHEELLGFPEEVRDRTVQVWRLLPSYRLRQIWVRFHLQG